MSQQTESEEASRMLASRRKEPSQKLLDSCFFDRSKIPEIIDRAQKVIQKINPSPSEMNKFVYALALSYSHVKAREFSPVLKQTQEEIQGFASALADELIELHVQKNGEGEGASASATVVPVSPVRTQYFFDPSDLASTMASLPKDNNT
jgi:hypothetical protein